SFFELIELLDRGADKWAKWIGDHRNILHYPWIIVPIVLIFWRAGLSPFYIWIFFWVASPIFSMTALIVCRQVVFAS
ncbi:MAG: hypothetical protein CO161_00650, partial [Candidatus Portnoybacteria bacterium CG_4_9_14_3_um_filter_44_9]